MATDGSAPRRGLPRRAEDQPSATADQATAATPAPTSAAPDPAPPMATSPVRRGLPRPSGTESVPPAADTMAMSDETPPAPAAIVAQPTAVSAAGPAKPARASEPRMVPGIPLATIVRTAVVVGVLLVIAAIAVLVVRWLLGREPLQAFINTYPGEYPLPEAAPVGIPAWLGWQHFFNIFLMVLIIRSGLQVRTEKRPSVFWTPRNDPKGKISLSKWFHQSLDILWIANGAIYIVVLFVTGQWMKIVPTSWAVFPNAISAGLQYVSLDWPTENGWVNYNSLQQIAYFLTVFIAAPVAIATGVRMSGIWPANAMRLNRIFPIEWARAIHFPTMLYFVGFIIVHVTLVLSTGALRNLNHIYASQDTVNWAGFWIFAASIIIIAGGWIAARPLVLAPIARLFGKVSR